MDLRLGGLPARTHTSQGEAWTVALALRLASAALLRSQGDDPVLLLDDVLAALDPARRAAVADICAGFEQVLVTAAAAEDVPPVLQGHVAHLPPRGDDG